MFKIIVVENYDEASREAFKVMKEVIDSNERPVLGLATGSTPIGLYKKMMADHKTGTSYKKCITFNLDEYIGLPKTHEQTYYTFMHDNLFNGLDIPEENIHIPVGDSANVPAECIKYEEAMKEYHIDIQLLGIGGNGHIGFNEPGTPFDTLTHIVDLQEKTRQDNARFFEHIDEVPTQAITMGIATIMKSKKVLLIATGENKADAIYGMIKGPVSEACPASALQNHNDVVVIVDKAAASKL
ncbi:glucosamine-6-phosphate deaminase [Anaerorhabdus sp.]|uniref:glucosamine-6-phosphate deaminase n=1 Tax=Anaerorhabdus sp. TaxID=1872524 RepID=UPI002B1F8D68|nr:glucosamine-6-phosphate deaminase [Anaerorhabdus sp.]MEA4874399.1 glucosamine-6-phosphate deaminase [Anaerorhabdus sp.]